MKNDIIQYKQQSGYISIDVKTFHWKYADKLLRSRSFEELWHLFKDAESPLKEMTESYAALKHMRSIIAPNHKTFIHIGDGARARTGALFAFHSRSFNISIDPVIHMNKINQWINKYNVFNFHPIDDKYEKQTFINEIDDPINIICVHAHVDLEEMDQKIPAWKYLYSNPCCYYEKQTFSEEYMKNNSIKLIKNTIDWGILSEKREIFIYKKG